MSASCRVAGGIPEPPWLADLPRLGPLTQHGPRSPAMRKLPVPAMSHPGHTSFDVTRALALGLRGRCGECGCAVSGARYVVLRCSEDDGGNSNNYSYPGGVVVHGHPPSHLSCALYACMVCPFLQRPTSQARRDGTHRGGAAVAGFSRYGIAYFNEPVFSDDDKWAFGYVGQTKMIEFVAAKELLSAYHESLAADAKTVKVATRLYWTDSATDKRRLAELERIDSAQLEAGRAVAHTQVNGYTYRLAFL